MQSRIITESELQSFNIYLQEEEKSKNTIEKYLRDVENFIHFVGNQILQKCKIAEGSVPSRRKGTYQARIYETDKYSTFEQKLSSGTFTANNLWYRNSCK